MHGRGWLRLLGANEEYFWFYVFPQTSSSVSPAYPRALALMRVAGLEGRGCRRGMTFL